MKWTGRQRNFWKIKIRDIEKTRRIYVVELEIEENRCKFERRKGKIQESDGLLKFKFKTYPKQLNRFYEEIKQEIEKYN